MSIQTHRTVNIWLYTNTLAYKRTYNNTRFDMKTIQTSPKWASSLYICIAGRKHRWCLEMSRKCPALTSSMCCPFIPKKSRLFAASEEPLASSPLPLVSTHNPLGLTGFGRRCSRSSPPPLPSCVSCWAGGCWRCRGPWSSPGRSPHAWSLRHSSSLPVRDRCRGVCVSVMFQNTLSACSKSVKKCYAMILFFSSNPRKL